MGAASALRVDTLAEQLRALGVRPGDAVIAHVAMRELVPVEDGPKGVLAALRRAVGANGTLLFHVPCETAGNVGEADQRTAIGRQLSGSDGFDPQKGPPRGRLGEFARAVIADPAAKIAPHPAARFAAFGKQAAKLLEAPPWDDPLGPGSPLDRLCALQGKVLDFGVDPATLAIGGLADYYATPRSRAMIQRHYKTIENGKTLVRSVRLLDDADEHRYDSAFDAARRQNFARHGKLGRASATLYEAAPLLRYLARKLGGPDLFRTVLRVYEPVTKR
jgi:aminoglycoside 3-N-acetyltransferase